MQSFDWPPAESAYNLPDGVQKYGSTGQLWKVQSGQWVRVPNEKDAPAALKD